MRPGRLRRIGYRIYGVPIEGELLPVVRHINCILNARGLGSEVDYRHIATQAGVDELTALKALFRIWRAAGTLSFYWLCPECRTALPDACQIAQHGHGIVHPVFRVIDTLPTRYLGIRRHWWQFEHRFVKGEDA